MAYRQKGDWGTLDATNGVLVGATITVTGSRRRREGHRREGLRQETKDIRVTIISPGVVESELANTISNAGTREMMKQFRAVALKPDAIAHAIAYAIEQPAEVDVNEIVVRPTAGAQ